MNNSILNKESNWKDLRGRVIFLFIGIFIYRLGTYIPVPGVSIHSLKEIINYSSKIFDLFNLISGGAIQNFSIFSLGIMPYISASIILQLLAAVIPKLNEIKKSNEGSKKISSYTRYLTFFISVFESYFFIRIMTTYNIIFLSKIKFILLGMIILTTGTLILMWIGEQITEFGIGNGISMILFCGILSTLNKNIFKLIILFFYKNMNVILFLLSFLFIGLMIFFIVFVEKSNRNIKVVHAMSQQGNRLSMEQKTILPFKINMAGVMPAIFATSIYIVPVYIFSWISNFYNYKILLLLVSMLNNNIIYSIIYALLIIFFSYFYIEMVYSPRETSDNLKKSGVFIPGIRPGYNTEVYIKSIINKLTMIGSLYMIFICITPNIFNYFFEFKLYFVGTSLLIIVVVAIEFITQLQTHIVSKQYESLIKKTSNSGVGLF